MVVERKLKAKYKLEQLRTGKTFNTYRYYKGEGKKRYGVVPRRNMKNEEKL